MKKTIYLITYSKSANYGAALQLYANYKYLEKLGFEVKVVDYQNPYENSQKGIKFLFSNSSVMQKVRWFISSYFFGVMRNSRMNFDSFYNLMNYTDHVKSVEELQDKADIYCVGSDQVWNPLITNGFDSVFTLDYPLSGKKISYASSMGSLNFANYDTNCFHEALKAFDLLSVREQKAADYIREMQLNTVEIVLDPTLLFGRDEWLKICENEIQRPIKGKYVLVYSLAGKSAECGQIANKVAQYIGAEVVNITLSNRKKGIGKDVTNVTPLMFVNYIANASFVVTNSFHGTCFSINMGTPFCSVRFSENPGRAIELLSKFNLLHRLISANDDFIVSEQMVDNLDLISLKSCLAAEIDKSKRWLSNAVK